MSAPNIIVRIACEFLGAVACGSLDYKDGRHGHKSRAEAAAALFDQVRETRTPGIYYVMSEESPKLGYLVDAVGPDTSCQCDDATFSRNNKTGLCKHKLSAILYHTIKEVLAETPDDEPEPDPVPAWVAAFTNERS